MNRTCEHCGAAFCVDAWTAKTKPSRFCSRKCWAQVRRGNLEERFWAKVNKTDDCWLWTGSKKTGGYGQFSWRPHNHSAHRLAWELTNGPIPDGLYVCHTCDVPACVRPDHMFLGTPAENMTDRDRKGRGANGERTTKAKLTEEAVREIRQKYSLGNVSQPALAAQFGIRQATVWAVIHRKTWAHIE